MTTSPEKQVEGVRKRPRRGEIWRRKSDGLGVSVEARRTVNPMEPVRSHSDMRWSLVLWTAEGADKFGCDHECHFLDAFEFVEREGSPDAS
jgi:hypothetical protein